MRLVISPDFDGDDTIGKEDLKKVINRLTGADSTGEDMNPPNEQSSENPTRLTDGDMAQLINNVSAKLKAPPQFDFLLVPFQVHFAESQTYLISTAICSLVCATFVCSFC